MRINMRPRNTLYSAMQCVPRRLAAGDAARAQVPEAMKAARM
jgi:hypothetical protein